MASRRYASRAIFGLVVSFAAGLIVFQTLRSLARADDAADDAAKQEALERKERYTKWMRTYSEGTKIKVPEKNEAGTDGDHLAELVPAPVFRYSDEERAIPDATLWIWTTNARPIALQKVEGNNHGGGQGWTICFTSLSEGLINAEWPTGRKYSSTKPGLTFRPIPEAEVPADNARARVAQIRTLKDRFTGRLAVNADGTGGSETRTIAKPLFEYADPKTKLRLGAIFGMSATGTNPDLLLLIEARRDADGKGRWEYATARMTSTAVRVRLDDGEVWAEPAVDNAKSVSENWLFYFLRRDFK